MSPATTLDAANGKTRHAFPFFLQTAGISSLAVGGRSGARTAPALDSNEHKLLLAGGSKPVQRFLVNRRFE